MLLVGRDGEDGFWFGFTCSEGDYDLQVAVLGEGQPVLVSEACTFEEALRAIGYARNFEWEAMADNP